MNTYIHCCIVKYISAHTYTLLTYITKVQVSVRKFGGWCGCYGWVSYSLL